MTEQKAAAIWLEAYDRAYYFHSENLKLNLEFYVDGTPKVTQVNIEDVMATTKIIFTAAMTGL